MSLTYFSLFKQGESQLLAAGIEAATTETEWIILDICKLSKAAFLSGLNAPVSKRETRHFFTLIQKRISGIPLAYLLGKIGFRRNLYAITPGVLIPRPETELLVEKALALIKQNNWDQAPFTLLEFGFGSGIISIELALAHPQAQCYAWDKCARPYRLATQNAKTLKAHNVQWIYQDFFKDQATWKALCSEKKPVIFISNPPYIPDTEIPYLDDSVKNFEPLSALKGGKDGLFIYKKLCQNLLPFNIPMLFEIGMGQAEKLKTVLTPKVPSGHLSFYSDLQGIPRVMGIGGLL